MPGWLSVDAAPQSAQAAGRPQAGPRLVTSLEDILGKKPDTEERRPEPITLAWTDGTRLLPCEGCDATGLVPHPEGKLDDEKKPVLVACPDCAGEKQFEVPDELLMEVSVHYPANPYVMQVEFLELSRLEQQPEVGPDGKETFPNEDVALLALIHEMVDKPMWLKNKVAFQRWKKVAPLAAAALKRKLMNTGGLDADFFADSRAFMEPALRSLLVSASQNGSGSRQSRQTPSPPPRSPDSSTTTASGGSRTGSGTSPTTSGSSPSTPTTAPPTAALQPTQPTGTS